jgi:hypothetical protein
VPSLGIVAVESLAKNCSGAPLAHRMQLETEINKSYVSSLPESRAGFRRRQEELREGPNDREEL